MKFADVEGIEVLNDQFVLFFLKEPTPAQCSDPECGAIHIGDVWLMDRKHQVKVLCESREEAVAHVEEMSRG
jgi:hypothetical protein